MLKEKLNGIRIHKNLLRMTLIAGVFMVTLAPSAMAQGRARCDNSRGVSSQRYDSRYDSSASAYNDPYYSGAYSNNYNNRNNNRYNNDYYRSGSNSGYYGSNSGYYENQDTTGKAAKRVGIGAAIGAGTGVLLGGKKGAIIGAGAGALGGYIYHRGKVNSQYDRLGF